MVIGHKSKQLMEEYNCFSAFTCADLQSLTMKYCNEPKDTNLNNKNTF